MTDKEARQMVGFFIQRSFRSVVCLGGSNPLIAFGLVAFVSAYLLSWFTNFTTVSFGQKEVTMEKQLLIPILMFFNGVATNLFSAQLGVGQT
ncbi:MULTISPECIES: hypothetical protein [unclassified Acinetobacter]|uniref:hypothetical protein n=1 Tax=unclassified Acinetobacter TaxID=196816 RepID=UPI00211F409B|nr:MULTISPECIES: hypothetical protein [unclassified Acinetobacter]